MATTLINFRQRKIVVTLTHGLLRQRQNCEFIFASLEVVKFRAETANSARKEIMEAEADGTIRFGLYQDEAWMEVKLRIPSRLVDEREDIEGFMGFLGLGKSSRREKAAALAKAEAAKKIPTTAARGDQSKAGNANVNNLKRVPTRENRNPNVRQQEQTVIKQVVQSKPQQQVRRNEAVLLRRSIVADRRKSQVNGPVPSNPNPTQTIGSSGYSCDLISSYIEKMEWVKLEGILWQVSTNIFKDQSLRAKILEDGIASKCVDAAAHSSATAGVVQKSLYVISQVSYLDEAGTELVRVGVVQVFKNVLLTSTDSHTVSSAVRALRNLMGGDEATAQEIGREQCALSLLEILRGTHPVKFSSPEVQIIVTREAAAALANLTQFGRKYQNQLIRADGIKILKDIISNTSDDETRYHMAKAFANFASESRWHGPLVEHGVVLQAQRFLHSSKDKDTVAEIARLLGNIAITSAGRAHIVDLGGVEELTEKLVSSSLAVLDAPMPDIVNALHNICLGEKPSLTACLRGALPVLIQLSVLPNVTSGPEEGVRETAFKTLVNIALSGQQTAVLRSINSMIESAKPRDAADLLALRLKIEDFIVSYKDGDIPNDLEHLSKLSKGLYSPSEADSSGRKDYNFQPSGRMLAITRGNDGLNMVRASVNVSGPVKSIELQKDQFILGQVLGKGGYGTVYLAQKLGGPEPKYVAIKQFHTADPYQNRLAAKEQKIWEGLDHENVVKYEGCFIGDDGGLNLVVEYIDGWSLARHLSRYSAFPEDLVAEISRQILDGLEYLHANGVIHRDLKPANVMVSQDGKVKITDFGVSSSVNVQTIGQGNAVVGTPWYIAPEMVEQRPYTSSVDVWSLGCTILELATGKRPYHELNAMQALFRMVQDRRPIIPKTLSPVCQSFLEQCWIWDPTRRPSAKELKRHPFLQKRVSASSQH